MTPLSSLSLPLLPLLPLPPSPPSPSLSSPSLQEKVYQGGKVELCVPSLVPNLDHVNRRLLMAVCLPPSRELRAKYKVLARLMDTEEYEKFMTSLKSELRH